MRPSSPRSSRISSTDGAVLALELAGAAVDGDVVGALVDLDAQAARRASVSAAPATPRATPSSMRAAGAAGQADALGDAGDRADRGVLALVARDEQDALLVADVDRQRDVHGREDDGVVEGDEEQRGHGQPLRGSTVAKGSGSSDVSALN